MAALGTIAGKKIVAMTSSTGGPKALQSVITKLPKDLPAPVVIVQHMPAGFTKSLADRLNQLSELTVKEAVEGDVLENGKVYIAKGGKHLHIRRKGANAIIHYSDKPSREGVKPCANYMFESLIDSQYEQIICVVLTGMGADGTEGIEALAKNRAIYVIAQNEATSTVYGMPKSIVLAGYANKVAPLDDIAQEITIILGGK